MDWKVIVLPIIISLGTALAAGAFQRPKVRGEGKQAEAQGRKTDTDADVALRAELRAEQLETLKQTREAAARADKSRDLAQKSEEVCLHEKRLVILAFDEFINDMESILAEPDPAVRARLGRAAISKARGKI